MNLKRRNLVANFAGTMWVAALALLFTPVYVRRLGVEAYGLVGFYMSMQAVFMLFDMGLGTTLNRELARRGTEDSSADSRTLVQTLETLYWAAGLSIATLLCALAPVLNHRWIHRQTLSTDSVQTALVLMAIAIGFNFPTALYAGGLFGLMKPIRLNVIVACLGTLRWGGAAALLVLAHAGVVAFFAWQTAFVALQTLLLAAALNHAIGSVPWKRRFRTDSFAHLKSFASQLAAVTLLGALLTQADKLIVSRLATLQEFGYYALAATVASGLALVAMPFFTTAFPQFTALVALGDDFSLRRLYHGVSQLLAAFLLPAALFLAFFARDILAVWTARPDVAQHAAPFLSLLAAGFALNGVAYMPYALQLAHGWVSLLLRLNVVAMVVLIPCAVLAVMRVGPLGAAAAWVVLNAGYILIGASLMHRRLLRGELWRWYAVDLARPGGAALLVAVAARWLTTRPSMLTLAAIGVAMLGASLAASGAVRDYVRR